MRNFKKNIKKGFTFPKILVAYLSLKRPDGHLSVLLETFGFKSMRPINAKKARDYY